MIKYRKRHLTEHGVTLLELIAILMLLALVSIKILPKHYFNVENFNLELATQELISNIRYSQYMSMKFFMTKSYNAENEFARIDNDLWGIRFDHPDKNYIITFEQNINDKDKEKYIYKKLIREYVDNNKYEEPKNYGFRLQSPIYSENIEYSIEPNKCTINDIIFFDSLGRPICNDSKPICGKSGCNNNKPIKIMLKNQDNNYRIITIDPFTGHIFEQ